MKSDTKKNNSRMGRDVGREIFYFISLFFSLQSKPVSFSISFVQAVITSYNRETQSSFKCLLYRID